MDPISVIALSLGAGWASGLNLYATVLTLGILHDLSAITLPPDLQLLGSPVVLSVAAVLYLLEFCVDKVPFVNTAWDALHTFIRIPLGAVLAAASAADIGRDWMFAAALAGGALAAGTHVAKTGSRAALAALPVPFAGFTASLAEDFAAIAIVWLAVVHPLVLLGALAVFVALLIWLLPKLVRAAGRVFRGAGRWLHGRVRGTPP